MHSNTTLVKVKLKPFIKDYLSASNSNTTLVKVKLAAQLLTTGQCI